MVAVLHRNSPALVELNSLQLLALESPTSKNMKKLLALDVVMVLDVVYKTITERGLWQRLQPSTDETSCGCSGV